MQSSNSAYSNPISDGHHVVDWQLVRTADTGVAGLNVRNLREQIKALEARATTLLLEVLANPRAVAGHRALAEIDAQIAALRADLA
jgi:hypothetical protein